MRDEGERLRLQKAKTQEPLEKKKTRGGGSHPLMFCNHVQ